MNRNLAKILALASLLAGTAMAAAPWHHPLDLDGGGYWHARVRVTVTNDGDTPWAGRRVSVTIGTGQGEADLAGQPAAKLRLTDAAGVQMLFTVIGPDGRPANQGPIAAGSRLVIPAECPAHGEADYYIYFDNPAAGPLPYFLEGKADGAGEGGKAVAHGAERMRLSETGADAGWYDDKPADDLYWDHRAVAGVFNFSDQPRPAMIALDLSLVEARMRGRLARGSIVVTHSGKPVAYVAGGGVLLFEADVPARSATTYYVYFSDNDRLKGRVGGDYAAVVASPRNLVKNPSFESGEPLPDGWTADGSARAKDGVTFGLDEAAPGLGRRSVRMFVPREAPKAWRGWHQEVAVEPGKTYVLGAWIKTRDVPGEVRLYVHRLTADGRLVPRDAMTSVGSAVPGNSGWTFVCGELAADGDTAKLQLHLTMDQPGTLWHDGLLAAECLPARLARWEARPVPESAGVRVWPVEAVVKVFPDDPAPQATPPQPTPVVVSAARNEKEPLQVAVRTGRAVSKVRAVVDPAVGPGGTALAAEVNVVGYVPIDHATNYYQSREPAWHAKIPNHGGACDGWPGRWPDPLLPDDTFDLEPNQTRAVWATFDVPRGAPPGDYAGRVRLVAEGKTLAELPYRLHVWDFTLPDESHVAGIYDVRLGNSQHWGGSLDEMYPKIIRFMAAHRLCPDTIRPGPKFRYRDGKVEADFTDFDRAAEVYFNELKLPFAYTPHDLYLFGWGMPPRPMFGERPYPGDPPYEDADRSLLRPEYKKVYQACLKAYWDHVKAKGWEKRIVMYISDEPFDSREPIRRQMKALCAMIHEVDPAIPIYSSTWRHVPDWDGSLNIWGIGHYGVVPPEVMRQRQAAGDRVWFTTDGHLCTDTPYCAVERLLPHYCFKYGVQAYEFWGVAWLTYDPYRFGWHAYIPQTDSPGHSYFVRYPNGDGFLIYPGRPIGQAGIVSSIRFEQAREGIEDYEYLYLLRQRTAAAKSAGRDVSQAEAALARADDLVTIPNAGGRYSSKILPEPARLYQSRQAVAEAIEGLKATP